MHLIWFDNGSMKHMANRQIPVDAGVVILRYAGIGIDKQVFVAVAHALAQAEIQRQDRHATGTRNANAFRIAKLDLAL